MVKRLIYLTMAVLLCVCASIKTSRKNIAVIEFEGKNVLSNEASIVSDSLRTAFVKSGNYNVIDKSNMDEILLEQKFQQSSCTDISCAVKIGRILNVKKMVLGTLSKINDDYQISAKMVDVETGRIDISDDIDFSGISFSKIK